MKHLSLEKVNQLEKSTGFLSNYLQSKKDEMHVIGEHGIDTEMTYALLQLGYVNKLRNDLLELFKNKSK